MLKRVFILIILISALVVVTSILFFLHGNRHGTMTRKAGILEAPYKAQNTESESDRLDISEFENQNRIKLIPSNYETGIASENRGKRFYIGSLSITGSVKDSGGISIPNAEIQLSLVFMGYSKNELLRVQTDVTGQYYVFFPDREKLAPCNTSSCRIAGRAFAAGHVTSEWIESDLLCRYDASDEITLDFTLDLGATLRGRVVDSAGTIVERATVMLHYGETGTETATYSDSHGSYCFKIETRAPHDLFAFHPEIGISSSIAADTRIPGDLLMTDLVLQKRGTIRGFAHYPDGNPAVEIKIKAALTDDDVPDGGMTQRDAAFNDVGGGSGLRRGIVHTDSDGFFRFSGLQEGRYRFSALPIELNDQASLERTYMTGEQNARVTINTHRIRLEVVDEKGLPFPGSRYSVRRKTDRGWMVWRRGFITRQDGCEVFAVQPGNYLRFQASSQERSCPEIERYINKAIYEQRIVLKIGSSDHACSLKIVLIDSSGQPLYNYNGTLQPIQPEAAGTIRFRGDGQSPLEIEAIPQGIYHLRIEPIGQTSVFMLPIEDQIEVLSDRENSVTLQANLGGRIRLIINSLDSPSARVVTLESIKAVSQDGRQPIELCPLLLELSPEVLDYAYSIEPGIPAFTGVLQAGWYRICIYAVAYHTEEKSIYISPGEATDLVFSLTPR